MHHKPVSFSQRQQDSMVVYWASANWREALIKSPNSILYLYLTNSKQISKIDAGKYDSVLGMAADILHPPLYTFCCLLWDNPLYIHQGIHSDTIGAKMLVGWMALQYAGATSNVIVCKSISKN